MEHIFEGILAREIKNLENFNGQIKAHIMASLSIINSKEKVNLYGKINDTMKVHGKII